MITKICEQCGREYRIFPSRASKSRFCSKECAYIWQSENIRGENHQNWKGGKVVKTCKYCGEEYTVKRRGNNSHFCSRECSGKWYSENARGENSPSWAGGKITKVCEYCGEEYMVAPSLSKQRFCSRECMGKWRSENIRGENHPLWKPNVKKVCEQCGKEYEIPPWWEDNRRFCSYECMGKWVSGKNHPQWKGGISFEPYCSKFSNAFKESIREMFGRVCFLCPTTEKENGKKLCVHHVNYNKDCLCDDSECEFVPLCLKCHSKTNFNRDYWENLIMEKLEAIPWK